MNIHLKLYKFAAIAAALLAGNSAFSFPLITQVVETGGDNEATDTVPAKFTGQTFSNGIAGEFLEPFTVPVFGEDVPAYVDRAHQWNGATSDLPILNYLLGGEYIMCGNDNRDNASLSMVVTVSAPVVAYLLIDNRLQDGNAGDPPTFDPNMLWVTEQGWQPVLNGLNRNSDNTVPDEVAYDEAPVDVGPGVSIQQYASIYSKQFPAGAFELLQPDNGGRNMYGVVVTRVSGSAENPPEIGGLAPANGTLFHPAASGFNFNVTTASPNQVAASNISLVLNGTDVTGQFTVGGTGTSRSGSFTSLAPDTIYRGQIIARDQAGRATTNSFIFDTFVESTAVVIEAEDYNHGGGQFNEGTVAGSFDGLEGSAGIDYNDVNRITMNTLYRMADFTGIANAGDASRSKFATGATDFALASIYGGDWANYTRTFPSNSFRVYLRASGSAQQVRLDRVTSDRAVANQTTFPLGTFNPAGGGYGYAALTDALGAPVLVNLSGAATMRLTALTAIANLQMNYLLFVPTSSAGTSPYISSVTPAPGATSANPDAAINIVVANGSRAVTAGSVALSFNGANVTSAATVSTTAEGLNVSYDPPGALPTTGALPVTFSFADTSGATISTNFTITARTNLASIPVVYSTPVGSGVNRGFNIHIHKASNDAGTGTPPALPQTSARAEQQLAGTLIDPLTTAPYDNEAGGADGTGRMTNAVVNFQQSGTAVGFIPGDEIFPNVDPASYAPDPNNIAMEATAYLELAAGTYRFGVVSDDGFRVTTGPTFAEATQVLGVFEGGRGDGLPGAASEFEFHAPQAGLYPVRLLYYEGQGGGSVEFYSVDLNTSKRVLINDSSDPSAIKAYTGRTAQIFTPTVSITAPSANAVFESSPTNVTVTADAAVQGGTITKVEFFSGTNRLGESTSAPFSLTLNNAEPGRYSVSARATDNKGLIATSPTVNFVVGKVLGINFQAASAVTPDGYLADTGDVFGDRGNGYSYGWDDDNTQHARERNSVNSPNKLYDTFNHMQKTTPLPVGTRWEITLPNGRYKVYGASGDATAVDSAFNVQAEGVTFITGIPVAGNWFFDGVGIVTVSDGNLTISNGPGAANNKINFLDIFEMPAETAQPVLSATRNGSNLTVTWTGGGMLEATPNLTSPVNWSPLGSTGTHTESAAAGNKFFRVRR